MAERASLMRKNGIVNQGAAIGLILFLTGCSGNDEANEATPSTAAIEAPIIWQTGELEENLSAFAVANEGSAEFLVGFENGGLQLIDFDGAPVSEPGPYRTGSLGSGTLATIQGADLVLFPGASRNADNLVLFVYGDGLQAPIEIGLDAEVAGTIQGTCANPADYDGAILNVAYWTDLDSSTLIRGRVRAEGENLIYEPIDRIGFEKYLTSCDLVSGAVVAGGGFGLEIRDAENTPISIALTDVPVKASGIMEGDVIQVAASLSGGDVVIADSTGASAEVFFRAGLSSETPETVGHLVLSDLGTEDSFPNGFLAVESQNSAGPPQLIFVDRVDLFDQLAAETE